MRVGKDFEAALVVLLVVVLTSCSGRREEPSTPDSDIGEELDSGNVGLDGDYDGDDQEDIDGDIAFDSDFQCIDSAMNILSDLHTIAGYTTVYPGLGLNEHFYCGSGSGQCDSTEFLRCLTKVVGGVDINDDEQVDNLSGLRSLRDVSGWFRIGTEMGSSKANLGLVSLDGLVSLERVGSLLIDSAQDLTDINGLKSLRYVGGDLEISDNPMLHHIDEAMEGLTAVGGSVIIQNDATLSSVEMLRNVQIISGSLTLRSLPRVGRLEGLRSLQYVGSDLEIFDTSVTSLAGLNERLMVHGDEESTI